MLSAFLNAVLLAVAVLLLVLLGRSIARIFGGKVQRGSEAGFVGYAGSDGGGCSADGGGCSVDGGGGGCT